MSKKDYTTFGKEWKKEINKIPKGLIIDMLANKGREVEQLKLELQAAERDRDELKLRLSYLTPNNHSRE